MPNREPPDIPISTLLAAKVWMSKAVPCLKFRLGVYTLQTRSAAIVGPGLACVKYQIRTFLFEIQTENAVTDA